MFMGGPVAHVNSRVAELPGVPVLSADDCQCSPGYTYDTAAQGCEPCARGEYKDAFFPACLGSRACRLLSCDLCRSSFFMLYEGMQSRRAEVIN